jgi:hypothetical protein
MGTMKSFVFRVLLVDEDADLLDLLTSKLDGYEVRVGNRKAVSRVTRLLVEVEPDGSPKGRFTDSTVGTFDGIADKRFDLIVLDYAYAAKDRQAQLWNEDGQPLLKEQSNADLLRLSELRKALIARAASRRAAERFFSTSSPIALRSFQHDRQFETLGTFHDRLEATKAVFPNTSRIYPLNGFELIYGEDKGLRDRLYHDVAGGRSMYRHTIGNFTKSVLESAMLTRLATQANRVVVLRGTAAVAILLMLISVANAFAQPFVARVLEHAGRGEWGAAGISLIAGLGIIGAAAFTSVVVAEFVLHRFIEVVKRSKP